MYDYGTLKPVKAILIRGGGRGRIMEGWSKLGYIVHVHGKITTKPLWNYYILIRVFKNKEKEKY
jgi:hypothetical protein